MTDGLPALCAHGIPKRSCIDCNPAFRAKAGVRDRPGPIPPALDLPNLLKYPPGREPGYVVKPGGTPAADRHVCDLPAEWIPSAVWRCLNGHLWVVDDACETCRAIAGTNWPYPGSCTVGLAWWPATWRQRRKYGGKRATLAMANENQEQYFRHLKPPRPPSTPSPTASWDVPPPPPPPYNPGGRR